jgi:hypothetical protein
MAKSFRGFREHAYDYDEWGSASDDDDAFRDKDHRMKSRRDQRRRKASEKYAVFDDKIEE